MVSSPFITVVTPAYNAARWLPDLLASVSAQEGPTWEQIVIDDGSSDNGATRAVIERAQNLRWHSQENCGQYAAINAAFDMMRGEVAVVISADDVFEPGAFARVARLFAADPALDIVYGSTIIADEGLRQLGHFRRARTYSPRAIRRAPARFFNFGGISHCSIFFRTRMLQRTALQFDTNYLYAGDTEWMIRLFRATGRIVSIADPLSRYRVVETSLTRAADLRNIMAEVRKLCVAHGESYRRYRMRHYLAHALNIFRSLGERILRAFWLRPSL